MEEKMLIVGYEELTEMKSRSQILLWCFMYSRIEVASDLYFHSSHNAQVTLVDCGTGSEACLGEYGK